MPAQATVWGRRWLLAGAALGDAAPAPAPDTGPTQARHQRAAADTRRSTPGACLQAQRETTLLKKSVFLSWQNKYSAPSLSRALPDSAGNAINQKTKEPSYGDSDLGWRSSIAPGERPRRQRPRHRASAQVRRAR